MQCKNSRGQSGAGNFKKSKQSPEEQRIDRVQQHVVEVIAERVQVEESILDPEARVGQRIPLRQIPRVEPDVLESLQTQQRVIVRNVPVIVPDEVAPHCGKIADQRDERKKTGKEDCRSAFRCGLDHLWHRRLAYVLAFQ